MKLAPPLLKLGQNSLHWIVPHFQMWVCNFKLIFFSHQAPNFEFFCLSCCIYAEFSKTPQLFHFLVDYREVSTRTPISFRHPVHGFHGKGEETDFMNSPHYYGCAALGPPGQSSGVPLCCDCYCNVQCYSAATADLGLAQSFKRRHRESQSPRKSLLVPFPG